jgi:D-cysteine desulfhydrase
MTGIPRPDVSLSSVPTPTERLDALSEQYGSDLYVKRDDQTAGIAQGNKVRKLEYLFDDAIERGADTVVTCGGLQSNHCRATAVTARRVGLEPYLLLRGDEPDVYDGNLLLDHLVGAEVEYISSEAYYDRREETFEATATRLEREGRTPYVIPAGGSNPIGTLGYLRAYEEIRAFSAENDVQFDRIFVATGSAGTYAGLLAGALYFGDPVDVVGVSVSNYTESELLEKTERNVAGLSEILGDSAPDPELVPDNASFVDYLGPGYAEPSEADVDVIVEAGRLEGIVLDTCYTGKAFRAFLEESGPDETNLFVHTGGSYGMFPLRERLTERLSS